MKRKEDLRIVYMGTPDFAVESLKALVEGGYNVVGVITMPDKPAGRGHKIQFSPVKQYALDHNLPILQPEKLKDEAFLEELRTWQADLQIVVAFRMLPEVVWNMPPMGTFNLHASLLPDYRGAAPINWAIINGEKESGITTFFIKQEIDTGAIILQERIAIAPKDTAGDLHDNLMYAGGKLVTQTVDRILANDVETQPQPQIEFDKKAPKIFKETCRISWSNTAEQLNNFVRGMAPHPAAWCEVSDEKGTPVLLKIFEIEVDNTPVTHPIGTLLSDGKTYMKVAVLDGYVSIVSLQMAGKKRMHIGDFLRGAKFNENWKIN